MTGDPTHESRLPEEAAPATSTAPAKVPDTADSIRPYVQGARYYLSAGWPSVLPVDGKGSTPTGMTGYKRPLSPPKDRVMEWAERRGSDNLTIALPKAVVGLDLDYYKDDVLQQDKDAAVALLGKCPTTMVSSSRFLDDWDGHSGIHLYRLPADMVDLAEKPVWVTAVHNCIDVIRFAHRQAVCWPSVHHSGRQYRWLDQRSGEVLDAPAVPDPNDLPELPRDVAEALLKPEPAPKKARPPKEGLKVPTGGGMTITTDQLRSEKWCPALADALLKIVTAVEGGGGRHDTIVTKGVMALVRLGEQGHRGADDALDLMRDYFLSLVEGEDGRGDAESEWDRAYDGAEAAVESDPTDEKDKGCCGSAGTGEKAKKEASISVRMIRLIETHYLLFRAEDGHAYAVAKDGGKIAQQITSGFVIRACRGVLPLMGSMASGASDAAKVLTALAADGDELRLWLRVAHPDEGTIVLDLGIKDDPKCVVVTREGWEIADQPPEGVYFRRSRVTRPLPEPVKAPERGWMESGEEDEELADLLHLGKTDRRWLCIRGWLAASLIPEIPRPMLAFIGQQGSAKTTRATMVVNVLDPKPAESLGGSFGKNQSDDEVKAVAHYLVAYDNLGNVSASTSDHLARLVTGNTTDKRMLYTDGEIATLSYRRTGVFTAINLPNVQPDALERLVPIVCERMPEDDRLTESELWAAYDEAHPRLLGAVLDDAVRMIRDLPAIRSEGGAMPRMADYWQACTAVMRSSGEAYVAATKDAMKDAAEADPFVACVVAWLERDGVQKGTPAALYRDASRFHFMWADDVRTTYWPKDVRGFSKALVRDSEPLRALGVTSDTGRSHGARWLSLTITPDL